MQLGRSRCLCSATDRLARAVGRRYHEERALLGERARTVAVDVRWCELEADRAAACIASRRSPVTGGARWFADPLPDLRFHRRDRGLTQRTAMSLTLYAPIIMRLTVNDVPAVSVTIRKCPPGSTPEH